MPPERLGLIAGGGDVPASVARSAEDAGMAVHVLAFEGVTDPDLLACYPHSFIRFDKVGGTVDALKKNGCDSVCMVGKVARPDFGKLRPDMAGISLLPKVLKAAKQGDDALLQVLVDFFQKKGFTVLGAHEVAGDVLVVEGLMGGVRPTDENRADIEKGIAVVDAVGALDIGQGAVIQQGLVLAVEAAEGTDRMLQRCRDLTNGLGGVLVKLTKPGQDHRVDLPTIGVTTVEGVAAAGLNGIAVEADAALVIDRAATVEAADRAGIFIVGVRRPAAV
ncbi:MAG: LpxI family protein [Minwuia sp.]|uniref:LpxI family protein n=1 Tax=Minwuia sp. TaxID=2493630 RepID=UPI003A876114